MTAYLLSVPANLLLWEVSFGQSHAVTRFAADALPMVLEHLEVATQELRAMTVQRR